MSGWVDGWVGGVRLRFADLTVHQLKYQQRTEAHWSSLFHLMAETLQTQFVREQSELQSQVAACSPPQPPPPASPRSSLCLCSQVKYREEGRKEAEVSLFSLLPETLDMQHARELRGLQSEVEPRRGSGWRQDGRMDGLTRV